MSGKINFVLTLLLVLSALFLVKSQYQARRLFVEHERALSLARQLEVQSAQLQLDQSTLGKHARIEDSARRTLNMAPLSPERVKYLTVGAK